MAGLSFSGSAQYDKTVAADGSGDFLTIQAAILAAPGNPAIPYKVFIKNGIYKEKVTINRTFVTLIGESVANVVIRWDNYYLKVPNLQPKSTATVTINANDVVMINITVENRSANTMDGPQALALNVNRDRCAFKNCRFIGGQDTIANDRNGARQYFKDCYIDGNTDFIYGSSTALFDNCILFPRDRIDGGSGGYVTAASTPINQAHGYVFRNCIIPNNNGVTKYTLARPWGNDGSTADIDKAHNQTVFLNTTMGQSIKPEGWSVWNSGTNTSFINYAEYKSVSFDGAAIDISSRVAWSKQLSDAEAALYTTAAIFTNSSGTWNPCNISADFCTSNTPEIALSNFRIKKGNINSKISCNINWPVGDINVALYRSTDSLNYTHLSESVLTLANYNFNYTDDLPVAGSSYYYKMVASKTGLTTYTSEIIRVDGPDVLPLKLLSFTANADPNNSAAIKLLWKTTGEENTKLTAIQRSDNNKDFIEIGTLKTKNTPGIHEYVFVDKNVKTEIVYYRLQLLDKSGAFSYSKVLKINLDAASVLMIYPNPVVKGVIKVQHPVANSNAHLILDTILGTTILNLEVNVGAVTSVVDFSSIKKGMYLLSFLNSNTRKTLRVVVP
ncbi:MAG: pectinesterase family protein [Bacteroidota bacterium]